MEKSLVLQNFLDFKILPWIKYLLSSLQNGADLGRIILLACKRQNEPGTHSGSWTFAPF